MIDINTSNAASRLTYKPCQVFCMVYKLCTDFIKLVKSDVDGLSKVILNNGNIDKRREYSVS